MLTEILLRAYTGEGKKFLQPVARLIENNTDLKVSVIDHTKIDFKSFEHEPGEKLVSLDRHLCKCLKVDYYQISRVFGNHGDVLYRHTRGDIYSRGNHVRILDTDMVYGDTIKIACSIFGTDKFSVPLVIKPNQDLIDIEDLFQFNSLLHVDGGYTDQCNYLHNSKFFMNRTSLPVALYKPMCDIFDIHPSW